MQLNITQRSIWDRPGIKTKSDLQVDTVVVAVVVMVEVEALSED